MADTNQKTSKLSVSPMNVPYCIDLLPISAVAKGAVNISPFRSVESCDCSLQPPQGSKFCNSCWPHVSKLSREEGKSCSLMHWPVICHRVTTSAFVSHVHDLLRRGLSYQPYRLTIDTLFLRNVGVEACKNITLCFRMWNPEVPWSKQLYVFVVIFRLLS
jgi:hypothetical protein